MPEKKKEKLYTSLEPSIRDKLVDLALKENTSPSAYMRRLVIHDLINRGLLGEQELTRIVA